MKITEHNYRNSWMSSNNNACFQQYVGYFLGRFSRIFYQNQYRWFGRLNENLYVSIIFLMVVYGLM